MNQRQVVHAALHERAEHKRNDIARAGTVRAGAADRTHAIGQHAALGVEREFAGRRQIAAVSAADELIGAVAAPTYLAAELDRGVCHNAILRIETGLLPKAATDIADQHTNAFLRPLEDSIRQNIAGRARRLRLHMQDQPSGLFLDLGNGAARLHRRGYQPLADQIERYHMRGFGEGGFNRCRIAIAHCRDDIVGRIGPDNRRAGFDCGNRIDDRRQHFIVDDDGFRRGLRCDARCRHHGSDRFASEAHDLMRQ